MIYLKKIAFFTLSIFALLFSSFGQTVDFPQDPTRLCHYSSLGPQISGSSRYLLTEMRRILFEEIGYSFEHHDPYEQLYIYKTTPAVKRNLLANPLYRSCAIRLMELYGLLVNCDVGPELKLDAMIESNQWMEALEDLKAIKEIFANSSHPSIPPCVESPYKVTLTKKNETVKFIKDLIQHELVTAQKKAKLSKLSHVEFSGLIDVDEKKKIRICAFSECRKHIINIIYLFERLSLREAIKRTKKEYNRCKITEWTEALDEIDTLRDFLGSDDQLSKAQTPDNSPQKKQRKALSAKEINSPPSV